MDLIASSGTESAELIGLRLRQSGLWHEAVLDTARRNQALEAPGPSPHRYLTLKLDTALKLEVGAVPRGASKDAAGGFGSPKYGGFACLAAHAWAVGNQLRAIRQAFVIAALLKRSLVLPRLTCHCDRDPSGTLTELITKGCQLPTAEAEQYLPFECPLEHLLNLEAWADAAARDATYTLLPASTVLPTASTPLTPAALAAALARAGPPASQPLGAVLGEEEPTAAAVVLELTWPTTGARRCRPKQEFRRSSEGDRRSSASSWSGCLPSGRQVAGASRVPRCACHVRYWRSGTKLTKWRAVQMRSQIAARREAAALPAASASTLRACSHLRSPMPGPRPRRERFA